MQTQNVISSDEIQNFEDLAYKRKNDDLKKFQNMYILFLWLTACALMILSAIAVIGLGYIFLTDYRIISVVDSKYFNIAIALLLIGIILSVVTGLLIFTFKNSSRKTVLTILVTDLLAIGSLLISLLVFDHFNHKINNNHIDGNIFNSISRNIEDYDESENWNKIHLDLKCCGIRDVAQFMLQYEYTLEYILEMTSPISDIEYTSNEHEFLKNAENFGIQWSFCRKLEETFHRGCGDTVLNIMYNNTNALKLFGNLLIPMLLTTIILIIFGYICVVKNQINVWSLAWK